MNSELLSARTVSSRQRPHPDAGQFPAQAHPLVDGLLRSQPAERHVAHRGLPRRGGAGSALPDARRAEVRQGAHRGVLPRAGDCAVRYGGRSSSRIPKDNASDNFLQVVREVDLAALLARIPHCRTLVTTGQKATDTLRAITGCGEPAVGESVAFEYAGRSMRLWRMPSSSRAYPRPVEWKAGFYRKVFEDNEIL